jgi:hypothetical protein
MHARATRAETGRVARKLTAICLIYFIGNNLLHKFAGPFATYQWLFLRTSGA